MSHTPGLSVRPFAARPLAVLCLAVLLGAAPSALARPEMAGQAASERFAAMDADKDGTVSREEFFAAQPNMKEAAFAAIDTDGDGMISAREWEAFTGSHGAPADQAHGAAGTGAQDPAAPASVVPAPVVPAQGADHPDADESGAAGPQRAGNKGQAPELIMPRSGK